jgi:urease accessory protein
MSPHQSSTRVGRALVLGAGTLFFAQTAAAHTGTGLPGGFGAGFHHPFGGFDHLLAMVSVGLWGAILRQPLIYVLPVLFPLLMLVGALLGMLGVPLPPVEIGVALSVLVLGGCVALTIRARVWSAVLIVSVFAVFHGYAHGYELPAAASPIGYSAGFVFATGLLHLLGVAVGCVNDWRGGAMAIRGMGAAVSVAGVWFWCRAIGL